jgi:hypothetical protein
VGSEKKAKAVFWLNMTCAAAGAVAMIARLAGAAWWEDVLIGGFIGLLITGWLWQSAYTQLGEQLYDLVGVARELMDMAEERQTMIKQLLDLLRQAADVADERGVMVEKLAAMVDSKRAPPDKLNAIHQALDTAAAPYEQNGIPKGERARRRHIELARRYQEWHGTREEFLTAENISNGHLTNACKTYQAATGKEL